MAKIRRHVIIRGRVQGVWFRASTQDEAKANNVTGWVKNTFRGHVEAVFEGNMEDVEKVIQWCHKGPELARVDDVEITSAPYTGEFSSFSVIH